VSRTVAKSSSPSLRPTSFTTVRPTECIPVARLTTGFGPVTVPKGPTQVQASSPPIGSEDAAQSSGTGVNGAVHSTVTSSPALATGGKRTKRSPASAAETPELPGTQ